MPAVIRAGVWCMTMLSFRVPDDDAAEVQRWADALGVDRSEILRDALHRHLVVLNGEADARRWEEQPATDAERSLEAVAYARSCRRSDRIGSARSSWRC